MVRRCVKVLAGQEYAAKIINTKKLSARGRCLTRACPPPGSPSLLPPSTSGLRTKTPSIPLDDGLGVLLPCTCPIP